MKPRSKALFSATCLALLSAPGAWAAETDSWQREFTPYLYATGLNGTLGIRGVTSDVDVNFGDVVDALDLSFMGTFLAQKGPWSFGLDGTYTKLSGEGVKSVSGEFGQVSVDGAVELTSKLYIYQGSVGYRVLDAGTTVDLIGALRYIKVDAELQVVLDTDPGIVFPGGTNRVHGAESWTDAVVGARLLHPLTDTVSLMGYADVGAGGSDLTYQLMAGVNWKFKERYTAKLGYRYLDWDYEDAGTVWDMAMSGPYLALGFRF